jgi:hypothetical protein
MLPGERRTTSSPPQTGTEPRSEQPPLDSFEGMGPMFVTGAERRDQALSRKIEALRRSERGRIALYVGAVALVSLAYYLAGRLGLALGYLDGAVTALWPPAGLGLAVLFLYGIRLWPGVVIGDLLLADFSTPPGTVAAQTVGNTVALVIAVLLLRRLAGGRAGGATPRRRDKR